MDIHTFFQAFYLVFLILISVGPGFLTIANIAMTHNYKTSATAVCGCFTGDCILITAGAFFAKKTIESIPNYISVILLFFSIALLLYLAVKFYKTDVRGIAVKQLDKKSSISFALTLFCLKMSSPICIIGYSIIFTQIIKNNATLSACLGGYFASLVVNIIMVSVFGTIGKKINIKILYVINKISSVFIGSFAIFLLVKFILSLT